MKTKVTTKTTRKDTASLAAVNREAADQRCREFHFHFTNPKPLPAIVPPCGTKAGSVP